MSDLDFTLWMKRVDEICIDQLSVPADCLPDGSWAEMHGDGMTPQEAFDQWFEDTYGDAVAEINAQYGMAS